ncbi:unnamed protein product [Closterium sp. NIES-64]|nr:unnamed protein product [Closterium sp. NIES-64]
MAPVNLGQLAVAVAVAGAGVMTTREHMQAVRNAGNRSDAATGDCSVVAGDDRPGAADDPCVIEHLPRGSHPAPPPTPAEPPHPLGVPGSHLSGAWRQAQRGTGGRRARREEALAPGVGHIADALHWDVVVTAAVCMHIALAVMCVAVAVLLVQESTDWASCCTAARASAGGASSTHGATSPQQGLESPMQGLESSMHGAE